jgi:uncharacterized protein
VSETTGYDKPLPRPTATDQPHWDALRAHETKVQRCTDCGTRQWYPRDMCSACASFALAWEAVEPRGVVRTFTVQHHPTGSKFDADIPFAVAVVQLDDAPEINLVGRIVDADPADVHIGAAVRGRYLDATDEVTLLVFELASTPGPNGERDE